MLIVRKVFRNAVKLLFTTFYMIPLRGRAVLIFWPFPTKVSFDGGSINTPKRRRRGGIPPDDSKDDGDDENDIATTTTTPKKAV